MNLRDELRFAALHESGHCFIARQLGARGIVVLRLASRGVDGSFHFVGQQTLSLAAAQRIAIAGVAATSLYADPEISALQLARHIEQPSSGFSRSDAALCDGHVSADALDDVLGRLRAEWPEVEEMARREVARLGVSW